MVSYRHDQVQGEAHWDCPIIHSDRDRVKVTKVRVTVTVIWGCTGYQLLIEHLLRSTVRVSRTSLEDIAVLGETRAMQPGCWAGRARKRLAQAAHWLEVNFHVS